MDAGEKATSQIIGTGAVAAATAHSQPRAPNLGGVVVAYVCENCGRTGRVPSSGIRRRPTLPDFAWPLPIQEVAVPCAGRLQPEHFLKALEDGADAVGVICCAEGNCHHVEGNRRCQRRLDYVAGLVEAAGLGRDRLMMFHLPGSAAEDMALGTAGAAAIAPSLGTTIAAVREAFLARLATLSHNPLGKGDLPDESPYEVDSQDESDE